MTNRETVPPSAGHSRVLRLFGAAQQDVQQAAESLANQTKTPMLTAFCRSKGAESLVALQAGTEKALKKAQQTLQARFAAEIYAEGSTELPTAVVQTLHRQKKQLTCADAAAGALLEQRLEALPGAEQVFDFGRESYAEEQTAARIDQLAHRRVKQTGELALAVQRVRAAQRLVRAELTAACVEREACVTVLVGNKKGCWLRTVRREDAPALWLLDIIRRAACGLPQAAGTLWLRYQDAVPQQAMLPPEQQPPLQSPPRKRHWLLWLLMLLLLLAGAALAAAWFLTGGDFAALPQRLQIESLPSSGARLL